MNSEKFWRTLFNNYNVGDKVEVLKSCKTYKIIASKGKLRKVVTGKIEKGEKGLIIEKRKVNSDFYFEVFFFKSKKKVTLRNFKDFVK